MQSVFFTKPVKNSSSSIIKFAGQKSTDDKINDEPIECNDKKDNEKYIHNINSNVYLRFFRPYYNEAYLLSNKVLPVIYASVMYYNKIWGGLLMNICIEFNITSNIKSEKDLINNRIDGKYMLAIRIADENVEAPSITDLDEYINDTAMIDTIISLAQTQHMTDIINQLLEKKRIERIQKYGSFDDIEIPVPKYNFNKVVENYERTGQLNL